ncbi:MULTISPECIES: hypothetical protein [unclassified Coleofasciculus]|uniref:hypothetical protein n=1 Tax=unclassified Coleofasciculus TaxID=2692782 RepID=UPI001881060F|nr:MULTISPECIES: hypothetical protein [unclassified Coleofasciculus]MBE9126093.1 hypothetical protein [Coleofasciculus sp. LEGE 07081]MBE9149507.1 hypothetical protein [Coleofasciculus sp. LEGE 07092]
MTKNPQQTTVRVILSFLMAVIVIWGLVGCSEPIKTVQTYEGESKTEPQPVGRLSEVAPPPVIQQLSQSLEAYQPQVEILSLKPDQVLQNTTVSVQLQVRDLPIFKNPDLEMGPHLHVILDNQPYIAVYNTDKPLVFEDLSPGTHTLRVFASRPWHESFKNEGAYAQTTFHIFTKTDDNNPNPVLPLLTYSRPKGSYGAEPIMLDFYLTNAPLHLIAQENPEDDIPDWRIRISVNGENFLLDRWQPIYLKGFKPGKNWVQLEFLNEQGNPLKNVYNNTARLISYEPNGQDTLSQLVRGELSAETARGIVNPNYQSEAIPAPSPTPEPTPIPSPIPPVEETPEAELEVPAEVPNLSAEPVTPATQLEAPEEEPILPTETKKPEQSAAKDIFNRLKNRLRRSKAQPSPSTELPEELEAPSPEPVVVTEQPDVEPETVVEEPIPTDESAATESSELEKAESDKVLKDSPIPTNDPVVPSESGLPPTLPEIIETPFPEPLEPEGAISEPKSEPSLTQSSQTAPTPESLTAMPESDS